MKAYICRTCGAKWQAMKSANCIRQECGSNQIHKVIRAINTSPRKE